MTRPINAPIGEWTDRPATRTRRGAVDGAEHLWVSFDAGFTCVFDADGDKTRSVVFRGAGPLTPTTMFFGPAGRLLATPGLHGFDTNSRSK